jgi:hypothetical protein
MENACEFGLSLPPCRLEKPDFFLEIRFFYSQLYRYEGEEPGSKLPPHDSSEIGGTNESTCTFIQEKTAHNAVKTAL